LAFLGTDPSQVILFQTTLDERIPKDAKCRFITKLVQKLDLTPLYSRYSHLGTNAVNPSALLATWFLSYSEGITSSRRIEFLCRDSQQFIYVSCDTRPDHATLCRFRQHDRELFAAYFLQIIAMAEQEGLTSFKNIHTDGTKIDPETSGSRKQSKTSEKLEKQLAKIRHDIEEYMQHCDTTDVVEEAKAVNENNDDATEIYKQIEKLKEQETKLLERKKQLEERKKTLKKEHQKNHKINLTDPDSRHMDKVNGKRTEPAYNAQASIEEKNQFIVACDVVTDPNDQNQLLNQIENVEQNLGREDQRQYTNDAGYHNKEQLEKIEKQSYDVVVADPTPENRSIKLSPTPVDEILEQDRKVQRADFVFHREQDYYECPAGKKLQFKKTYSKGRVYEKSGCQNCQLASLCLNKKNTSDIKRIYRDDREYLAEKMAKKLQTEQAKEQLKKRRYSIEPVFGILKHNMGFRRFNLRGHEKVRTEWLIMCIAYNIKKLHQLSAKNPGGFYPDSEQSFAESFIYLTRIAILITFLKIFNKRHY